VTQIAIPAVWMRGGTSKGLFLRTRDLPTDAHARDRLLLRALGSPDPYGTQVDGLGGATSSTSKAVLIAPSGRDDCDVDYHFGHVSIETPIIDWSGNCGNLSAAVGPFAVDEGLVAANGASATVRVWQANLGKRFLAQVPIVDGRAAVDGDCVMDGVAFAGAPIALTFEDAGGEPDGGVLPTGRPMDTLHVPGLGDIHASLVHAGNVAVFVRAADVGLSGTETPAEMEADPTRLERLNAIREQATVALGLAETPEQARRERPATPKIHWVAPPVAHTLRTGRKLDVDEIDLCARALSMGRAHHAYPGTSAIATAVAAALPGTVAHECVGRETETVRIGHAAGRMVVGACVKACEGVWHARHVRLTRTARRLMRGEAFVPERDA